MDTKHAAAGRGVLGLAFLGDAVYELLVRKMLCEAGLQDPAKLHSAAVSYVRADAQAKALEQILPVLSEDELSVVRRGRNCSKATVPRNSNPLHYRAATALEALFGYLYLAREQERIEQLFSLVRETSNEKKDG